MTAPQDAPAGPVLGKVERRALREAIGPAFAHVTGRLGHHAVDVLVDAAAPAVAALLSSAREEGAAAERAVARSWYAIAFEGQPEEQWLRANSAERARTMARAHYGRAMVRRGHVGPWEPLDGPS